MYRCSIDNAIAYTAEDLILFRESPFASWMERLTLENANHGIAPDPGSTPPGAKVTRQHYAIPLPATGARAVESLGWREFVHMQSQKPGKTNVGWVKPGEIEGVESCDIASIELDWDEAQRRSATLAAMRRGADFILNGQLAEAALSDSVDLLMRNTGTSAFGGYLYTPCCSREVSKLQTPFRLCYAADLLEFMQEILPSQMLVIGRDGNILPQQTRSHIYHYRAVKQRFVEAQLAFRKHRMPDPAESSHFGRWSDCANAVLKQRAMAKRCHGAHLDSKLFSGPQVVNRQYYDPDNTHDELSTRPFDSTLKTSDGMGW